MTLQQMQYIVAVDKYRHFVKAAESCHVTQSTLSLMIRKLEDELDVQIFNRNSHPVSPTPIGEKIISQAKVVLFNVSQLKEMILSERQQESGEVKLGVIPTVAPYILPKLFGVIAEQYPGITLRVTETRSASILEKLDKAELDVGLLATPVGRPGLLEIPVYYEKFVAYISPGESLYEKEEIESGRMPTERLWVLQEGHCLRNQVMNICDQRSGYSSIYEAGSIDTLVKIVDENGGYTIIPELHLAMLTEAQKAHVRKIVDPAPVREVSLMIRQDYVRERMLNILAESIRRILPEAMIDKRLKKFAISL